jgi:hypothetical protein
MNKRTVIANLNKIANELDNSGMFNEANEITNVMKRLAQFSVPPVAQQPVAAPPVAQQPVTAPPVAPPFSSPVVPAVPMAGAVPALGAPVQPVAPITNTTKPPYATSAGAQGTIQATPADPYAVAETALYQKSLSQIIDHFKNKRNDSANRVYEQAFPQFKNPQRAQLFAQQIQRLRSQYNPAQSKPGT